MCSSDLKEGDIKAVLKTMVAAPEFWTKEAITQKTKSPLELAISSVRALDATVNMPFMIYQWTAWIGYSGCWTIVFDVCFLQHFDGFKTFLTCFAK